MNPTNPKEVTAVFLRKYFYEAVLIALASVVVSLALMYNSLNVFIREDLKKQNIDAIHAIDRNTDALNTIIILSRQNQNR